MHVFLCSALIDGMQCFDAMHFTDAMHFIDAKPSIVTAPFSLFLGYQQSMVSHQKESEPVTK